MSDIPPISGKVGLDVTDFKTGIAELNRQTRIIESAFKAAVAPMDDWSASEAGLEKRIESLGRAIDIQKEKVEAYRKEYEKVRDAEGENSRGAQELEIKYNNAREALGKLEKELDDSSGKLDDLKNSTDDTGNEMKDLEGKTNDSRSALEKFRDMAGGLASGALKVGGAAIAGMAASVAGVATGITKMVLSSSEAAGELVDLSLQTGISTTKLQELAYAGEQIGTSTETMTGAMAKLTRSMDTAREQQQKFDEQLADGKMEDEINVPIEMARAFNQLGVSYKDSNGQLRDQEAVFADLITALGSIPNEAERDAMAMQLFGKSAQELNPLIKAGAEEITRLREEAHTTGAVMSEESVTGLEAFGDTLAGLKQGIKGTLGEMAGAFAPAFQGIADVAKNYLGQFSSVVKGADGDLVKMASGIGDLVGKIANDIAKRGPEFLQAGLNVIKGIINAITENLPQLMKAATEIITTLLGFIAENLPMMIKTGVEIVVTLVSAIIDNLPAIVEAGMEALIALIEGLSEAMPKLIPQIVEAVMLIVQILLEHLPELVEAGGKLLVAIVQGISEALPIIIDKSPELIQTLADALIALLPILADVAMQMIATIAKALIDNLPEIGEALGEIEGIIGKAVVKLAKTLWEVGKDIVVGIWTGISENYDYFMEQVKGFFSGIVDGVKEALGIHSPSAVFGAIGANAGMSYIDSLRESVQSGMSALQSAFGGSSLAVAPIMSQSGSSGPATVNNFYLNANYSNQPEISLSADIRLLQMLYGAG